MPNHLEGKISLIDYKICLGLSQATIGNMLKQENFEVDGFLEQLGKIIYVIIGDLGIKTLPDTATELRITHYLMNYYRDLTLLEIQTAFELAVVGELDANVEHFNSFDVKYACGVLNAFRKRKMRAYDNFKRNIEQPTKAMIEEKNPKTKNEFLKIISKQYQKYCENKDMGVLYYPTVYAIFKEMGLIKLSDEEIEKLMIRAKEQYKQSLQEPKNKEKQKEFKTILQNLNHMANTSEKQKIVNIAKRLAVQDFFDECKNKQIDLDKLVIG